MKKEDSVTIIFILIFLVVIGIFLFINAIDVNYQKSYNDNKDYYADYDKPKLYTNHDAGPYHDYYYFIKPRFQKINLNPRVPNLPMKPERPERQIPRYDLPALPNREELIR